jgi:hypothetical protein
MRIFVSVLYLLPFMFWSFLGIQTNFSSGPFQVTSTKRRIIFGVSIRWMEPCPLRSKSPAMPFRLR